MTVPIDRTMVGKEFDHTVFPPVTEAQILAYGAAYGETNPLYTDPAAAARGPHGGLIAPPTFAVFGNHPDLVQEHYVRYLHNGFRESWGFRGNPVRILLRRKAA